MKQRNFISLILCLTLLQGCASILPGNDPIVVGAERTTTVALATFDSFLQIEYANRAELAKLSPSMHAYAENIRRNGLNWLTTARVLTKAYKANRSPENKASLTAIVAVLQAAIGQSQVYLNQAKSITP